MKKTITLLAFYSLFFCITKSYTQTTTICGNDSIKLKIQNHKYGILEWEKYRDAIHWEKIRNEHDTTYVFKPEETAYYRSVNKLPNCEPVFSSQTLVQKSPTASAGGDRLVNDSFLFLGGNTKTGSTGVWSVLEGDGGVFSDINNPLTKFSGATGNYKLQWKLENSCGVSKDSLIVKFVVNQNHNKIVIVDSTDTVRSTDEQLANGEYIIEFNDPVPTLIDDETILVGTAGSGYLRRVNTVSKSGNTFTMTTSQGNLEDLLIEGGFNLGNIFEVDTILPRSKTRNPRRLNKIPTRGEILSDPKLRKGVHYYFIKEEIISLNNSVKMKKTRSNVNSTTGEKTTTIKFTVDDTLFDRDGISIMLDGELTFTPNISAYLQKKRSATVGENSLVFEIGLDNSTLVSDYEFTMSSQGQASILDQSFNLFTLSKDVFILVDGTPVHIVAKIDFEGKVTANVDAGLTFTHQFRSILTTNAGIKYENREWSSHYDSSMVNVIERNSDIQGGFMQKIEIGPKISFRIYDIAGPYIDTKLT